MFSPSSYVGPKTTNFVCYFDFVYRYENCGLHDPLEKRIKHSHVTSQKVGVCFSVYRRWPQVGSVCCSYAFF